MRGTVGDLVDAVTAGLQDYRTHAFNIRNQYQHQRNLRQNLATHPDECAIHIDFSENYNCGFGSEVMAVHFGASHQQATLHTGILYVGEEAIPFTSVSDCRRHDPAAIWSYLSPVLDYVSQNYPDVSKVHIFSDGPTTQYRNKTNFYLFSRELYIRGFDGGSWNFSEAGHGKGAADGVGASLKRTGDRLQSQGKDVPNAKALYTALQNSGTSVKLFFISDTDLQEQTAHLNLPGNLIPIPGTMRIHQLILTSQGHIQYRDVSCKDHPGDACGCEGLKAFIFPGFEAAPPGVPIHPPRVPIPPPGVPIPPPRVPIPAPGVPIPAPGVPIPAPGTPNLPVEPSVPLSPARDQVSLLQLCYISRAVK